MIYRVFQKKGAILNMKLLKNEASEGDGVKTNGKKRSEMIRFQEPKIIGCIEPVQCYCESRSPNTAAVHSAGCMECFALPNEVSHFSLNNGGSPRAP